MSYGIRVHVWGDYALFSRPELKVERCSYDMITPSAARGLLESVYWHPGLKYHIDRIYVCKPIRFTSVRRNEIKSKVLASSAMSIMNGSRKDISISSKKEIVQRAALILKDVDYVIEAHFDMTEKACEMDNPGKFKDIIMRRLRQGACYHQPYFGCREFPANFELFEKDEVETAYPGERKDLGFMLFDMDYTDTERIQPMFFRAILEDGILDLRDCEVMR